jgi:Spy/CpxP family protein refolding chaperone
MVKVIAALLIIIGLVFTQPMEKPNCPEYSENEQQMMDRPQGPQFTEKEPRKMMETIRVWKLTELLNLSEDQSTRFFPKLKEMRDIRDEFEQTRMKVIGELDNFLKDAKKFESEIKNRLQELETGEVKSQEKIAKLKKEIASILTPEQQAKFMLFQMRFDREMHEMISKAKERWNDQREMRQDRREEQRAKRKWRFW